MNLDEPKWKGKYRIPSARLKGWDYASASWYFVTVCTSGESEPFGEIRAGEMFCNALGEEVARLWQVTTDECPDVVVREFQVMPDHFHALLWLDGTPLWRILSRFKGRVTAYGNRHPPREWEWQERFHDHIVRYADELERIAQYIRDNPRNYTPREEDEISP